jgi:Mlc titration factor MtfA (ptsG expression regulator)
MIARWWRGLQARRERAVLERRAIPDDLWKRTLVRYPFLRRRDDPAAAELRRLSSLFLDRKEFSTTGGLRLTDAMAVAVAAQACLPVLRLGLERYDGFVGIVIHPDTIDAVHEVHDEAGVVHEVEETRLGEAMEGGPVQLAWPYVHGAGRSAAQGLNVVIHEFAHVLAAQFSIDEGVPLLPPGLPLAEWRATMQAEFEDFVRRTEAEEATTMDPYGASGPGEFFAVATESFFVQAQELKAERAALYAMLSRLYLQDPAQEQMPPRRT